MFKSINKRHHKSRLFQISKWIHKYIGLALVFFLIWMSISGILLNHPKAISSFSVPTWAVPSHYIPKNWNRSALTHVVYSKVDSNLVFASGKTGVWKSVNKGYSFEPFMGGQYPKSEFYRKTNHLYLQEDEGESWLLAGNDYGLFKTHLDKSNWKNISLESSPTKIVKFIEKGNTLLVLSETDIYSIDLSKNDIHLKKMNIRQSGISEEMPMIDFFFDLHSGKLFGFGGQLLFDLAGVVLFYLSFTALYTWLYPKKRRKDKKMGRAKANPIGRRIFQFLLKYHLSLGIWFALFLIIFGVTGFFMRPPFLATLVDKEINLPSVINHRLDESWTGDIQNGMFLAKTDTLVLSTSEGLWKGKIEANGLFSKFNKDWPIFVMGATVLEVIDSSKILVGSFSGIFNISNNVIDRMTGDTVNSFNTIRPGDYMVTGYVKSPENESFIFTHEQGVLPLPGVELKNRFQQPQFVGDEYRMPLWNYVFEIHNGRFFKGILGEWYILLLPLGSLLLVFITMSGVIDWLYHRKK